MAKATRHRPTAAGKVIKEITGSAKIHIDELIEQSKRFAHQMQGEFNKDLKQWLAHAKTEVLNTIKSGLVDHDLEAGEIEKYVTTEINKPLQ